MDLLSFMSSFKCCKNFPLKINFSESNFLEVYAVGHVGVWERPGRIRPRTKRVVVEYTGDVPVSTGTLPPELICSWVLS